MLKKTSVLFLISALIFILAFGLSAHDNDNGLIIVFDEIYTEMDDYFVFDYPGEWYAFEEYISEERWTEEWIQVIVTDEDPEGADFEGADFVDMGINHQLATNYHIDDPWYFREDEDEFYDEIYNHLQEIIEEDIEVLVEKKIEFKNRPAFELKAKIEMEQQEPETSIEFIQHIILVYENSHEQHIFYVAKTDEYSEEITSHFFESFKYMTD